MLGNKRAQSTLEYAIVISVVIAALLTVNYYMQKGTQGRLKESTDRIGRQFDSANFTTAWKTQSSGGNTTTTETRDISTGTTTSNITGSEMSTKAEYDTWGNATTQHY